MFNVHLDTVSGCEPVAFDGTRFRGRAIDAEGPAVALLAGIRAAIAAEPAIGTEVGVLIQAVRRGGRRHGHDRHPAAGRARLRRAPQRLLWAHRAALPAPGHGRDDGPAAGRGPRRRRRPTRARPQRHRAARLPRPAPGACAATAGPRRPGLHRRVAHRPAAQPGLRHRGAAGESVIRRAGDRSAAGVGVCGGAACGAGRVHPPLRRDPGVRAHRDRGIGSHPAGVAQAGPAHPGRTLAASSPTSRSWRRSPPPPPPGCSSPSLAAGPPRNGSS